jgi:DNA polymerase III subunit gamma/tau
LPIEEALAGLGEAPARPAAQPAPRPASAPPRPATPPRPTPFELDRARKSAPAPEPPRKPEPRASTATATSTAPATPATPEAADWRAAFHAALMELGLPYTADAVENSHVVESSGELHFTTSNAYKLALREEDLRAALRHIGGAQGAKPLRIKVIIGEAAEPAAPLAKPASAEDDVSARALANPEVQRFREVFGGEVRKVRNLKES